MKKPLFVPIVDDEKLNELFKVLRIFPGSAPARLMMESVFENFEDSDGKWPAFFGTFSVSISPPDELCCTQTQCGGRATAP